MAATEQPTALQRAFLGAALGRVIWGIAAFIAPRFNLRITGLDQATARPELVYMIRVFGARALALGLGYLSSDQTNRLRWQRLGLMVDTLDTVNGLGRLARGDVRRSAAIGLVLITAGYSILGAIGAVTRGNATPVSADPVTDGDPIAGRSPADC